MCKGNICNCPLPTVLVDMKRVEFLAHDEVSTRLFFEPLTQEGPRWVILNDRGLYITYDALHRAWGDLYAITGIDASAWSIATVRG